MSKTTKVVLIVTGVVLASLIGAGVLLSVYVAGIGDGTNIFDVFRGSRETVDETHAFDLDGISSVSVECASADINIVPGDEIKAELKGSLWAPAKKDEYLSVTEQGGELIIRLDLPTTFFNWADVDINVYLPKDAAVGLNVSCASGNTTIQQLALGDISIVFASGNARIIGCTGSSLELSAASGNTNIGDCVFDSARVTCQSGNIGVRDTQSAVAINCTSGEVDIQDVKGALNIGNTSGGVEVSLSQTDIDPIDIDVTSGNIKLFLNPEAAFTLDADTTSGGIDCDFERTVTGEDGGGVAGDHVSGKCNGGGALVTLSAISGGIDIRKQ